MSKMQKDCGGMNYLDLFAGIGGFHEGLNQAGFKFNWVGFSEIDKYAKQIYKKHFPEAEDLGDVRTIDTGRLPRINLITGGVPCQSWSIAGKRKGFDDPRGTMWYEFTRIIKECQPENFIAENVKGLLSHDKGNSIIKICEELCSCGYAIDFEILNTKWVLPQNRERVFIWGRRLDTLEEGEII